MVNFGAPHVIRKISGGDGRPCGSRSKLTAILASVCDARFGVLEPKKLDEIAVNFVWDPVRLLNRVLAVSTVYNWRSNSKYA